MSIKPSLLVGVVVGATAIAGCQIALIVTVFKGEESRININLKQNEAQNACVESTRGDSRFLLLCLLSAERYNFPLCFEFTLS